MISAKCHLVRTVHCVVLRVILDLVAYEVKCYQVCFRSEELRKEMLP